MKILKPLFFLFFIWGVLFIAIELFCGLFAGNNYFKLDMVDEKSAKLSFGYFEPNQQKRLLFPGHKPYEATINDLGLRDTGVISSFKNPDEYKQRILCIGDSFTFGLFVDDDKTYPYLLQQELNSTGTLVLNAGIGNTGIKDHWYYLKEKGIQLDPHIVIINFFGNDLDDLRREVPFYEEIKNDAPEKWWVKSNFFRSILGLYVQSKYNRWLSKIDDPRVKNILKEEHGTLEDSLYASWHYHACQSIRDPYADDLAPYWQEHLAYLGQIHRYLSDRGITMIYLIQPELVSVFDQPQNRHEDILINFLEVNQIAYINLIEVFKAHKDNVLELYNGPPRDFHLNEKGNKIVVAEIMKFLDQARKP